MTTVFRPGVLFALNLVMLICAIAGYQLQGWTDEAHTIVLILCGLLVVLGATELARWFAGRR